MIYLPQTTRSRFRHIDRYALSLVGMQQRFHDDTRIRMGEDLEVDVREFYEEDVER